MRKVPTSITGKTIEIVIDQNLKKYGLRLGTKMTKLKQKKVLIVLNQSVLFSSF